MDELYWRQIDAGNLPMSVIRRWLEHPEEMTVAQRTALLAYLGQHPELIKKDPPVQNCAE